MHLRQAKYSADSLAVALDSVHSAAFHTGLGEALYPSTTTPLGSYLNSSGVSAFAGAAYALPNFAVVADGATQVALTKWVEPFFKGVPATPASTLGSPASKFYGGQQRIESAAGDAVVIAFPTAGLSAPDATAEVLAALLGGEPSIKWTPGFTLLSKAATAIPGAKISAQSLAYSDAGLLTLQITGPSAAIVRKATEEAVKVLKSVAAGSASKEDVAKAVAKAKFDALTAQEPASAAITSAGTAVLHGLAPFKPEDVSKSYGAVSADKLKTVRSPAPHMFVLFRDCC